MLIVCPNCATSYMIDPAAVGSDGRTVRCARCKSTWFAGGPVPAPEVVAAVDSTIAAAEEPILPRTEAEPVPEAAEAGPDRGESASSDLAVLVSAEPAATEATAPVIIIDDAPSLVPPLDHEAPTDAGAAEAEEADSFAVRRQRLQARRKYSRRSSRWTALILVLVAANVALIGARTEVVRALPQTASLFAAIGLPVNLRNLKFENVQIANETQNGTNMLVVRGSIVSEADKPVQVPRLRFAARNATGQEVYTWTARPERSVLGPGERLPFRSEMTSPPPDAKDIMVRFFSARDIGAK